MKKVKIKKIIDPADFSDILTQYYEELGFPFDKIPIVCKVIKSQQHNLVFWINKVS
jgi:hypothetical protein